MLSEDQSPDILLSANGIAKSYEMEAKPSQIFFEKVFGYRSSRERFHALRPMSLSIQRGTSLGILGRNGAGKSTLLGILAGIIDPSAGSVSSRGRIAALIGIGQSFNIEESGRDNARRFCRAQDLAGATAREAVERIQAFAELGSHFDRPVKTYSSGMRARLNFACATCVSADLIIIDEVLAVGDAEFRSKCYGHIEASIDAGQTYIMVSHSPAIIGNYCNRALVLDKGEIKFDGDPLGAMQAYDDLAKVAFRKKRTQDELFALRRKQASGTEAGKVVDLVALSLTDPSTCAPVDNSALETSEAPVKLSATFIVNENIPLPRLGCAIRNGKGITVASISEAAKTDPWHAGETRVVSFEFIPRLSVGSYLIRLFVTDLSGGEKNLVFDREGAIEMQIVGGFRGGMVDLGFRVAAIETVQGSSAQVSAIESSRRTAANI